MKVVLVLMVGLVLGAEAWAVHRCKGADGKVVYQEVPCPGGEKVDVSAAGAPRSNANGARNWSAELAAVDQRIQIRDAIQRQEPAIGMTMSELGQALGNPTTSNLGNYEGETSHQLIYERGHRTWYVYTRNGIVRSIQNRESIDRTGRSQNSEPCPSSLTLRNMETSASSNSLSQDEKVERLRQIHEIRMRCR